ncbi:hypothetical protein [Actinomadura sp. K4S16]|uniref:hypothetical protein n=1 Tax=Actinomadura sp. K4S16 TaxID=1316147 RepID=UPI0011EDB096|nr:hypothetical protein [Actinomadura sp. K4S16]
MEGTVDQDIRQVGWARSLCPPWLWFGGATPGRGRGGDHQGDLSRVVGDTAVHLVGTTRAHRDSSEVFVRQGGAQLRPDVLGEREVRNARDGAPVEFGRGAQGGGVGGERLSDHVAFTGGGGNEMAREPGTDRAQVPFTGSGLRRSVRGALPGLHVLGGLVGGVVRASQTISGSSCRAPLAGVGFGW